MPLNKVTVLKASIRSFKTTVDAEGGSGRENVSIQLAEHYNSLRKKASEFPELSEHLPPEIQTRTQFEVLGTTAASFTDLKVYLNQLSALTDLLEE